MLRAPPGARVPSRVRKYLSGGDVRSLKALVALHDFELDALPLGQRAVAVHLNRAVVDEDVVSPLSLDEAVALLVREPLDRAFSHASSFYSRTKAAEA